jgi:hypothetical protein
MATAEHFSLISSLLVIAKLWADEKQRQFEVITSTFMPAPRRESTKLLQLCEYMSFLYQHPM